MQQPRLYISAPHGGKGGHIYKARDTGRVRHERPRRPGPSEADHGATGRGSLRRRRGEDSSWRRRAERDGARVEEPDLPPPELRRAAEEAEDRAVRAAGAYSTGEPVGRLRRGGRGGAHPASPAGPHDPDASHRPQDARGWAGAGRVPPYDGRADLGHPQAGGDRQPVRPHPRRGARIAEEAGGGDGPPTARAGCAATAAGPGGTPGEELGPIEPESLECRVRRRDIGRRGVTAAAPDRQGWERRRRHRRPCNRLVRWRHGLAPARQPGWYGTR
mmetsp:Transcript_16342/g.36566  ORF Transcript_16342/g.36566 Transcript_16342/m.36566 type:complete len:274 (+) Transcript_16342:1022-1843(+)